MLHARAGTGRLGAALALVVLLGTAARAEEVPARPHVLVITLDNQILNAVAERFIGRALHQAKATRAECLIIRLDTPGGLMEPTRNIVKEILQADVPVVVYVAPRGARAGSAGVFLTLAAHVAAMAPGTNIGAAHPVALGGPAPLPPAGDRGPGAADLMVEKVTNDAAAWARALAEHRGRNPAWAARAVKDSISTPAEEALQEHVVDLLADDQAQLLDRLDGRAVVLPDRPAVLHTREARVETLAMSPAERLLDALAHPALAYVLLLLGVVGLVVEIFHPGGWAPGVFGLLCLVLAFVAFQMLPVDYAGLALLVLGLLLVLLEVKVHSFGLLALTGLACLLLGSFLLIEPVPGVGRVPWLVTVPASAAVALILLFLVGNVLRAHAAPVRTGLETIVGETGVARTEVHDRGTIFVRGALWRARSDQLIFAGQRVRVRGYEGLTLQVERA
jgi:membrane-bound serine protease (ClpP class)